MTGQWTGSTVGAIAGLIFILFNAGALPGPAAPIVRGLGIVGFIVVMALSRPGSGDAQPMAPRPDHSAWRTYWCMVSLELVLLPVGVIVLTRLGYPELGLPWVALIVGVHFLPFATTFGVPAFRPLAWTLIGLGAVGAALAIAVTDDAGPIVAGVLSGVALLAFASPGPLLHPSAREPAITSS